MDKEGEILQTRTMWAYSKNTSRAEQNCVTHGNF